MFSHSGEDAEGGRGWGGVGSVLGVEEDHGHGWHPLEVAEVGSFEEF